MLRPVFITGLLCALHTAATFGQAESATTQPAAADASSPTTPPANGAAPTTPRERISYSLGAMLGNQLRQSMAKYGDIDEALVISGFQDAVTGGKLLMNEQEVNQAIALLNAGMKARRKEVGDRNMKTAVAFLSQNAKKPGVHVTTSGLQYKIVQTGTGEPAKLNDEVVVQYTGMLIDGTMFDSSHVRGEPLTFRVNTEEVIAGWIEVLQLMNGGAKWHVVIPPHLAYGEAGSRDIPPNSALIFDIEILEINPATGANP